MAVLPASGPAYQNTAADPTGRSFGQSLRSIYSNMDQKVRQVSQRAELGLTNAYANNNLLASRASLLGGATLALPSASEAMGEGRTLEAITTVAGAAGTIAGLLPSDIRLKTNIKRIGKLPNGIPLYHWEWTREGKKIAGDQTTFGVIAQEVLKLMPEAVAVGNDGYLRVNYGKIV